MNLVDTLDRKKFDEQIHKAINKALPKKDASDVILFAQQFFTSLFLDEFKGRRVTDILGLIISAWKFVSKFDGKHAKVEVFNPNLEVFGWQSSHTVLMVLQKSVPFTVDSVRMELNAREIKTHSIQYSTIRCHRNKKGEVTEFIDKKSTLGRDEETFVFIEVDKHSDKKALNNLCNSIVSIMDDVTVTVNDYDAMLLLIKESVKQLSTTKSKVINASDLKEGVDFLEWIKDDRFTFLGYVEYQLSESGKKQQLAPVAGTELGMLKKPSDQQVGISMSWLTDHKKNQLLSQQLITFAKSSKRSSVHRPSYPDYICIKKFDTNGLVVGEHCFLGMYTAQAYHESPSTIPLLRQKTQAVIERSGLNSRDYRGKELEELLAVYPRDELFQLDTDELYHVVMGTLFIQERRQTRLFMRKDTSGRFVSCLVYVPRDIFNTNLRIKIQDILMHHLNGLDVDFNTYISESVLARTHITIKVDPDVCSELDVEKVEQKIIDVSQSWEDDLEISLFETYGEEHANRYINKYRTAFSSSYREDFSPRRAAIDIDHIESVSNQRQRLSMSFYRSLDEDDQVVHFKLFHADLPVPLSDVMPIFENMGFRVIGERPYEAVDRDGHTVWLHDFMLTTKALLSIDIEKIREPFEDLFVKVWLGEAENDNFNRMVIASYMNWREIAILRSYSRYMRQIRISNSQEFISNTIVSNVEISQILIQLFESRFNPELNQQTNSEINQQEFKEHEFIEALDKVQNLTEDKILRLYLDLIKATMRTNYYQKDKQGEDKSYISFKLQPRLIPNVPLPVPMFEIFIYSPRIEGVHLRGGKVARGGLRWSDRYEDYRTEVLGLVKAQQVKNAVIVPVGAKGGFVAKKLPDTGRDDFMKEGIACYQTFITGLLNVTDNLVDGKVVKPDDVVCHDDDDYYLVVAADKGTATFSDIANEISLEKGHWLGDAFASGGSVGYDHKKMGITAKGAWISVERHFREIGINTKTTPFTTIGIGDMAGDVFGNGMLLSPHTKLVAAFNHMHIFFDPEPDTAKSFAERQRIFNLPRSSWEDYSKDLISKGGGIYSRDAKSIPVNAEFQKFLGTKLKKAAPNELINLILKAKADLLWIGGIGTYVMGSTETHADVGDKANDALRITGKELTVKVVGEGGNLGMTQLSRIEYSQHGGKLNTDFIDNAAGVDCSDHEVNIKILLNEILVNGDLTEKQRISFLVNMTEDVANLVLKNNYRQTQAISIATSEAVPRTEEYRRLVNSMVSAGKLNRSLEFLPADDIITERKVKGEGFTRPELSVLISYVKGDLKEELINSDLPDNESLIEEIEYVFPLILVNKYKKELHRHRLRREIISTQIANDLVNHMGITFVERLKQSTGAPISAIALSYIIARDVFRLDHWWEVIESLDYKVSSDLQMSMMSELMSLMRRACRWLIRNRRSELNVSGNMETFEKGIAKISKELPNYLNGETKEVWQNKYDLLVNEGVPEELASMVAGSRHLYAALGIIEAHESTESTLDNVANVYYVLGNRLELTWFGEQINSLAPLTHWQALAREAFREDLDWQQRSLTVGLLKLKDAPKDIEQRIDIWMEQHKDLVLRWTQTITEFKVTEDAEFSMYSVALRELLDLAQSTAHAAI
jgi:glutamate dehydrogenase